MSNACSCVESGRPGYASFQGTVLQGAELTNLLHGLESNDLLGGYTHMLTVRPTIDSHVLSRIGALEALALLYVHYCQALFCL